MKMMQDVAEDVEKIEQVVRRELSAGHKMLEKPAGEFKSPFFLSNLLLSCAKFNQYCFDKLQPVAVGLELLNFGVEQHHPGSGAACLQNCRTDNLSLISGDYYYSKGIMFASQVGASIVVEIMSQAIADITEAQVELAKVYADVQDIVFEENRLSLIKQAALCGAACRLGSYLAGLAENMSNSLKEFGQFVGVLYGLVEKKSWSVVQVVAQKENLGSLVGDARGKLSNLPQNRHRDYLTRVVEDLAESVG